MRSVLFLGSQVNNHMPVLFNQCTLPVSTMNNFPLMQIKIRFPSFPAKTTGLSPSLTMQRFKLETLTENIQTLTNGTTKIQDP